MMLFGKKEKESEDKIDLKNSRKITKNLKDLKPENKKKRKEPPKPWGKKERIIVLIILLATTIISAALLYRNSLRSGRDILLFHLPKLNLESLNIFKGETIVIEKE